MIYGHTVTQKANATCMDFFMVRRTHGFLMSDLDLYLPLLPLFSPVAPKRSTHTSTCNYRQYSEKKKYTYTFNAL